MHPFDHLRHARAHAALHHLAAQLASLGLAPHGVCSHHFAGRGRSGGPFGGGGHGVRPFGFGGGGPGGFGFHAGRKLSSADLQLLLLHLLNEEPRHGYELIKAVEALSNGFYSPSPGVIYPALTYLEEAGEAVSEVEGTRKRYQPTDAGRARLEAQSSYVKELLEQLAMHGRTMDRVRKAFEGGFEGDESANDHEDEPADRGWPWGNAHELRVAVRALRSALHEKRRAPSSERRRIAEILLRAAEEIRGSGQ